MDAPCYDKRLPDAKDYTNLADRFVDVKAWANLDRSLSLTADVDRCMHSILNLRQRWRGVMRKYCVAAPRLGARWSSGVLSIIQLANCVRYRGTDLVMTAGASRPVIDKRVKAAVLCAGCVRDRFSSQKKCAATADVVPTRCLYARVFKRHTVTKRCRVMTSHGHALAFMGNNGIAWK